MITNLANNLELDSLCSISVNNKKDICLSLIAIYNIQLNLSGDF